LLGIGSSGVIPVANKRARASWAKIFAIIAIGILVFLGLLSLAL
jgi:hypothetical protein